MEEVALHRNTSWLNLCVLRVYFNVVLMSKSILKSRKACVGVLSFREFMVYSGCIQNGTAIKSWVRKGRLLLTALYVGGLDMPMVASNWRRDNSVTP